MRNGVWCVAVLYTSIHCNTLQYRLKYNSLSHAIIGEPCNGTCPVSSGSPIHRDPLQRFDSKRHVSWRQGRNSEPIVLGTCGLCLKRRTPLIRASVHSAHGMECAVSPPRSILHGIYHGVLQSTRSTQQVLTAVIVKRNASASGIDVIFCAVQLASRAAI